MFTEHNFHDHHSSSPKPEANLPDSPAQPTAARGIRIANTDSPENVQKTAKAAKNAKPLERMVVDDASQPIDQPGLIEVDKQSRRKT